MSKLVPIQLENGLTLYMEANQEVEAAQKKTSPMVSSGNTRSSGLSPTRLKTAVQHFEVLEKTLSSFANYTLNAFKQVSGANVDKITLEFGVTVGGEAGIPYITKGNAEGNLKVTIECSLPSKNSE
jgi:hypothetical protein